MNAAAGWYPDVRVAATVRYWDGSTWTQHVAPMAPHPPAATEEKIQIGGVVIAVIPVIGVVVGLIMLLQHKPRTGTAMIVVGLVSAAVTQLLFSTR
jgi:uncharacterized protein DUF2510